MCKVLLKPSDRAADTWTVTRGVRRLTMTAVAATAVAFGAPHGAMAAPVGCGTATAVAVAGPTPCPATEAAMPAELAAPVPVAESTSMSTTVPTLAAIVSGGVLFVIAVVLLRPAERVG